MNAEITLARASCFPSFVVVLDVLIRGTPHAEKTREEGDILGVNKWQGLRTNAWGRLRVSYGKRQGVPVFGDHKTGGLLANQDPH